MHVANIKDTDGYFMKRSAKETVIDILCEIAGNLLIGFATYNIAASADFVVSGFSGIALILFKFFGTPMGTTIFLLNIPFALLCIKFIGWRFIVKSVRCIAIQSLILNYVVVLLPQLTMDRFIAVISVGVLYGISYALIYIRGSSTGGLDFIIMLVKNRLKHVKTGNIAFVLDLITLVAAGFAFKDYEAVIYGIIIVFISATTIDRIVLGMNSGAVAYIVTDHGNGKRICDQVDQICMRGSTILEARGGYKEDKKDVVMVVGSYKDIYQVQSALKKTEPDSFMIVLDSKEVQGEGFTIRTVAGEEDNV